MEIKAKLISIGNAQEGVNKQGNPWRKATAVFETQEQYPKTIAIDFFNSKLDEATKIPLGTVCTVKFDINSREYNGKWYTNCGGYGIEVDGAAQPAAQPQPQAYNPTSYAPEQAQTVPSDEVDDLPF